MGNNLFIMKLLKSPQFKPNPVIVITGASSGIGRELALQYAQRKCRLFLGARTVDKLKEINEMCRRLGSESYYQRCDVTKEQDCKNLIQGCLSQYGELDILVLNAGVNAHIKFEEIQDLEVYQKVMQTNFFGYLYCTKYAMTSLKKSKGQIVVLSSISGEVGIPLRTAYCSSKFAVTGFFEALRIELDNHDIAITIVCPPSVKTDMRVHDLIKSHELAHDESQEEDKRMPVEECAKIILDASDRRSRKVFFPMKAYLAVYVRPFFPNFVDYYLKQSAKL